MPVQGGGAVRIRWLTVVRSRVKRYHAAILITIDKLGGRSVHHDRRGNMMPAVRVHAEHRLGGNGAAEACRGP